MSVEEICALPVQELAADDCVLFMWATYPMLKEALKVIEAWGFKYKSIAFQWISKTAAVTVTFMALAVGPGAIRNHAS